MADRAEAVASIERRRALDHPVHGIWAIETSGDRRLVGNLLLKTIPASGGQAAQPGDDVEIGWHLHPDHWGHGYATEAGAAVLAHAEAVAATAGEDAAAAVFAAGDLLLPLALAYADAQFDHPGAGWPLGVLYQLVEDE